MEDENETNLIRKLKFLNLNKEVELLEAQIERFKKINEKYIDNKEKLDKLFNDNVIDSDGELKSSFLYYRFYLCKLDRFYCLILSYDLIAVKITIVCSFKTKFDLIRD